MRKFLLIGLLIVALGIVGCQAKEAEAATSSRGNYTTFHPMLTKFMNENDCFYHTHEYKRGIDNPYGLGLDIKIFDFKKLNEEKDNKVLGFLDAINVENKYDFNNQNYSVFLTLSVDLSSIFQGE